ncbi:MAG: LTA synthase family protein [Methylobacter sp.]|nr:LTA synthase family protein [Methylobacter sp.]MDP2428752.1 LTA synthase family protein [Methylobacter sp.]MDP3053232.1 LTA synthase family protein [Methylobacter sp.]MDP3361569.1 LTA synthase family protein [Methylobacter sp.]MDZ4219383.1 LTA synthase family protein [Methylobacter sp.]
MLLKLLPLLSTTVLYALFYLISTLKFDVQILPLSVPYDFLLQLAIAYVLYALSRRAWIFLVIHTLLMGLLYVGNAVKISFFGGPIMPDDVFALQSLLLILEGWRFFAAAIPLAAIASLLLFNFTMRHWSAYLASLVAISLGITIVYKPVSLLAPLDGYFGNSVWDQRSNYIGRGATVYTLLETARYFAAAEVLPDSDMAQEAADNLLAAAPKKTAVGKAFTPRNVHLVLLESFWDPNELKKAKYKPNPLSPEFRELWKNAGYSHALDPVFGGFTANSEFEVLCGFPVVRNSVKFERQLLNDVPCLPHLLADKGYRTIASHPNVPVFWNRVNAYRRMGFETYWSLKDFVKDDMNREFMSDRTLYRQVLEKISGSLEAKQPVLDYIVTYFGHWNYPLSESRPNKVSSPSNVEEVPAYANTIYYKTRELMEFIKEVGKRDPEGIIVVFGDHLPFLGENFAGYVESGVLTTNRSDFTPVMFKSYVSTPMIIIDGKRGPVKFGNLPLYQTPKLVLDLLNFDEPSIMDYTAGLPNMRIRPLPGLHFNLLNKGVVDLCKEPPYSETCQLSARWLENVAIVSNDLFMGRQFTRPKYIPEKQPELMSAPQTMPDSQ